jgi:hypothetical protein
MFLVTLLRGPQNSPVEQEQGAAPKVTTLVRQMLPRLAGEPVIRSGADRRVPGALLFRFSWIGPTLQPAFDLHLAPIVQELLTATKTSDMDSAAFTRHRKGCPSVRTAEE